MLNFKLQDIPFTAAIPAAFGLAGVSFYLYRKYYCQRYFKNRGIPGPEPHWLYGNLHQLWRDDRHEVMASWSKQYGDFFGIYEGPTPVLVTSNLEAVEQICIKQFPDFQGHRLLPIAPSPSEKDSLVNHMLWAQGEHWKRLRTAINPAFSTGKLKSYAHLVAESQNDFLEVLQQKADEGAIFDIRVLYQLLALDVIAEVGFGIDFKAVRNGGMNNVILKELRELLDVSTKPNAFIDTMRLFPCLSPLGRALSEWQFKTLTGAFKSIGKLLNMVGNIMDNRIAEGNTNYHDLLQLMINVSDLVETSKQLKHPLNRRDINAMSFLFFFAGYETTSSTLGFMTYCLATNPDAQEKLYEEIREKYSKLDLQADYETIMNEMPYLDWCVKEAMRLYPMAFGAVTRYVVRDTVLCDIPLTKQCEGVAIEMWSIHRNKDLWGPLDPDKFHPERFSPENSANRPDSAFLAFGYGPRQCIGMRLAFYEMKLTMVNLLRRFRIVSGIDYPDGKLPLSSRENALMPIDGIKVKLENRTYKKNN